jgi:hypothetical protein
MQTISAMWLVVALAKQVAQGRRWRVMRARWRGAAGKVFDLVRYLLNIYYYFVYFIRFVYLVVVKSSVCKDIEVQASVCKDVEVQASV